MKKQDAMKVGIAIACLAIAVIVLGLQFGLFGGSGGGGQSTGIGEPVTVDEQAAQAARDAAGSADAEVVGGGRPQRPRPVPR